MQLHFETLFLCFVLLDYTGVFTVGLAGLGGFCFHENKSYREYENEKTKGKNTIVPNN